MDRGQAYTLEAITSGLLLVGALLFALQATGVTPLSASTSSQHIENQQQATAHGALAAALEEDAVRVAVLNWNRSNQSFYGASERYYVDMAPTNRFGAILNRTFEPRGIVFNVYVIYERSDDRRTRERMLYRGEPSDHAVAASTTVTLYDDDVLYNDSQGPATVDDEDHKFDTSDPTDKLDESPVAPDSVHDVHNSSYSFEQGVDYILIDDDSDGKPDSIKWDIGGEAPNDGETFTVDYTPAVDDDRFYAADVHDSGVYNVVTVEVVAWRQ